MPSYKVISKGFMFGRTYDPNGRRKTLHADKPLKPVPSWLEPIKEETAAQRKKRVAAEKKAKAEAAESQKQKQTEIDSVRFDEPTGSKVETL